MIITIDKLKRLAEIGYITDTAIINECEKNPELLKTINIYEYVSQPTFSLTEEPVAKAPTETVEEIIEEVVAKEEPVAKAPTETVEEIVVEEKVVVEDEPVQTKKNKKS